MSSLLASLASSGRALDVFQRALSVIQDNIDNASTPGYATQDASLTALPLDITGGLVGGVATRSLVSSRNDFADQAVRRHLQSLGEFTAKSQNLNSAQTLFDVTGNSGVPASLSQLFQAFSAWSANPSDPSLRQAVVDGAVSVADSVRSLAKSLTQTAGQIDTSVASTVQQINTLGAAIQNYNVERLRNPTSDPAADASLHANLESLSQLVNITTLQQADGTVTVLAGDQTPLVIGNQAYALSASVYADTTPPAVNSQGPPSSHVLDWQGNDVTADVSSGQLGGLLNVRNQVLSSISGDAQQAGSLNQFAKTLADSVNQILQSGKVSSDPGAASGLPLFTYNTSDATLAAGSLTVNPSIAADQLAPADAAGNANGNAIQLASLGSTAQAALGGMNLTTFLSSIASNIGQQTQQAQSSLTTQQQATAQAKSLRDQISGVSLDAEAVKLIEFQRGYQAAARVLAVLNDLTDKTIQMIP